MDREELIRTLDRLFQLTDWQEENGDKGYTLCLRTMWSFGNLDVRNIRVQLTGINPLTGEDVEAENIVATFSFDQKEYRSKCLLTYHGTFNLRCVATMGNGEKILFRNQKITLTCAKNKPEIVYSVKEHQGFYVVEIRSNCWGNCRGKAWITVDGHQQRIDVPAAGDKVVRFYLNAARGIGKIKVPDDNVIIRQEG